MSVAPFIDHLQRNFPVALVNIHIKMIGKLSALLYALQWLLIFLGNRTASCKDVKVKYEALEIVDKSPVSINQRCNFYFQSI